MVPWLRSFRVESPLLVIDIFTLVCDACSSVISSLGLTWPTAAAQESAAIEARAKGVESFIVYMYTFQMEPRKRQEKLI